MQKNGTREVNIPLMPRNNAAASSAQQAAYGGISSDSKEPTIARERVPDPQISISVSTSNNDGALELKTERIKGTVIPSPPIQYKHAGVSALFSGWFSAWYAAKEGADNIEGLGAFVGGAAVAASTHTTEDLIEQYQQAKQLVSDLETDINTLNNAINALKDQNPQQTNKIHHPSKNATLAYRLGALFTFVIPVAAAAAKKAPYSALLGTAGLSIWNAFTLVQKRRAMNELLQTAKAQLAERDRLATEYASLRGGKNSPVVRL